MSARLYTPETVSAHFVGVGGAGMSALANILIDRGAKVSGSDLKDSKYVRALVEKGATISVGHRSENIVDPDVVVVSTAIPETNPEVVEARRRGIEVWPRAQMLAYLAGERKTIAVAGTHGKTSTSSMIAMMLRSMGECPSFCIGGVIDGVSANAENGTGDLYVVEADESDGSFVFLDPYIAVITNMEPDHLDHYANFDEIKDVFVDFMNRTHEDGAIVICGDDEELVATAKRVENRRVITYGKGEDNDYVYRITGRKGIGSTFELYHEGALVASSWMAVPGEHMVSNASAALVCATVLNLDMTKAAQSLQSFSGVRRRFDLVDEVGDITIVDDYGHHPTEIDATLKAAQSLGFNRVVVAFQPHRYTRVQNLAHEFGNAFQHADRVIILDVYSAGEAPIPGVSGRTIVESILQQHPRAQVAFIPHRQEITPYLKTICRPGDILLTMGAGDVTTVGPEVAKELSR